MLCVQIPADEVCGCPLVRDVFEPTGEYCRVSKRKCNKHYCWEKLRRAEVDLERVRVVSTSALGLPSVRIVWDLLYIGPNRGFALM